MELKWKGSELLISILSPIGLTTLADRVYLKRGNMKKIVLIIILMMGLSIGYSQSIEYTNQVTVEWDEVAKIESTDIVTYQVFTASDMFGIILVGETDLLEYTLTFIEEGEYTIGVNAKRELMSGDIVYSVVNWSNEDVPAGATPIPFVVRYIKPIQEPENLRLQ